MFQNHKPFYIFKWILSNLNVGERYYKRKYVVYPYDVAVDINIIWHLVY